MPPTQQHASQLADLARRVAVLESRRTGLTKIKFGVEHVFFSIFSAGTEANADITHGLPWIPEAGVAMVKPGGSIFTGVLPVGFQTADATSVLFTFHNVTASSMSGGDAYVSYIVWKN